MRNWFAVDMTDPENPTMPVEAYCRRRVSNEMVQKMDALSDTMDENVETATRSWPHKIGGFAAFAVALVSIAIFDAVTDGAETIPWTAWLWLIPAAVGIGVGLLITRS